MKRRPPLPRQQLPADLYSSATLAYQCVTPLAASALEFGAAHMQQYNEGGHDRYHLLRVMHLSRRIARAERADVETVELIAALHDVADFKWTGDEQSGERAANTWLREHGVDEDRAQIIAAQVSGISFKGALVALPELTKEGWCVRDSDKLDAIGNIGIERAASYGGFKRRPIHDPTVPVVLAGDAVSYRNHQGTTVNHYFEKLLLVHSQLHTRTARRIGKRRHKRMEQHLRYLRKEWEGKA